jgi:hypothetical protein
VRFYAGNSLCRLGLLVRPVVGKPVQDASIRLGNREHGTFWPVGRTQQLRLRIVLHQSWQHRSVYRYFLLNNDRLGLGGPSQFICVRCSPWLGQGRKGFTA